MIEKIEEILKDYDKGLLTCNERKFQIANISQIIANNFNICQYENDECKNCFAINGTLVKNRILADSLASGKINKKQVLDYL